MESAPGRGNLWARLAGGDAPDLVLLHHIDVVPADPDYWTVDPLSGEVRDGVLYGRGAIDTKGLGIAHLAAFLELHRSGGVAGPRRSSSWQTADEEAGGYFGVGWLVERRPELFADVGYVLNEGGVSAVVDGRVQVAVEVTQKVPYWLRLTTVGRPGHGSRPAADDGGDAAGGGARPAAGARVRGSPRARGGRLLPGSGAEHAAGVGAAGTPRWTRPCANPVWRRRCCASFRVTTV